MNTKKFIKYVKKHEKDIKQLKKKGSEMKQLHTCKICGETFFGPEGRKTCSKQCQYKWVSKILIEKWQKHPWGRKSKFIKRRHRKGPRTNISKLLQKIF